MPFTVNIKPAKSPLYQPSNQVPFEFEATNDEVWSILPVNTLITIEFEGGVDYSGYVMFDSEIYNIDNNLDDFTYNAFKVVPSSPITTVNNLLNAILTRPKNILNFQWTTQDGGSVVAQLVFSAKEVGFTVKETLDGCTPALAAFDVVQGTFGVMKPNYQLIYQMTVFDPLQNNQEIACHSAQSTIPYNVYTGTSYKVNVDFASVCKWFLKGDLPTQQCNVPVWGFNTGKMFKIRYGWSTKESGEDTRAFLLDTGKYFIINQKFDKIEGVEKYCTTSITPPNGHPLNEVIDSSFKHSKYSVAYLYYYYNSHILSLITDIGSNNADIVLKCSINGYSADDTPIYSVYNDLPVRATGISIEAGVAIFPVGILNTIPDVSDIESVDYLTISIYIFDTSNNSATVVETITRKFIHYCNDAFEFYFLNRLGGFDTIIADDVTEITDEITQTSYTVPKIARSFEKTSDYTQQILKRIKTGSYQTNTELKKKFRCVFNFRSFNEHDVSFIESFLTSEDRHLKFKYDSETSTLYTTRFIINHSSYTVDKKNKLIKLEVIIETENLDLK